MELYLDTSDVAAVKKLARIFPLAGVTTNPSIMAAGKTPLEELLPALHDALGGRGRLFAQVMAKTAEGMVEDARKLRAIINDLVVKVPVTAEGLAAIKMLKDVVLKLRDNGATVLISTHMLEMVENLWDVMIVMEQGHIAGSYTKADAQGKELDELFFEMTGGEKA